MLEVRHRQLELGETDSLARSDPQRRRRWARDDRAEHLGRVGQRKEVPRVEVGADLCARVLDDSEVPSVSAFREESSHGYE